MAPRVMVQSRVKLGLYGLVCVALTGLGVFLLWKQGMGSVVGWLTAGMFGLGAVVMAASLLRPSWLKMDDDGFEMGGGLRARTWRYGWDEVEGFEVATLPSGVQMAGFNFAAGARPETALMRFNSGFGLQAALPRGLPGSAAGLVETMNAYRAAVRAEKEAGKMGGG